MCQEQSSGKKLLVVPIVHATERAPALPALAWVPEDELGTAGEGATQQQGDFRLPAVA